MQALTPEQSTEQNRRTIRKALTKLGPRQWLTVTDNGRDYLIRSGHPLYANDAMRLTHRGIDGPPCEICLGTRWVPITRVVSRSIRGDEHLADRLLCKTCGGSEIADEGATDE
jgi:hypothetical protein